MRPLAFLFLLALFSGLALSATNGEGYIGCYTDTADRDLYFLKKGGDSTPSICRDLCSKAKYDYFGLQAGGQCFCDDNYGRYQKASNCNYFCSADPTFLCGGAWANSVYSVKTDLNHVKLGSHIDGLTHEQLHDGVALMRDLLPTGFDAQTLVNHIKNGTIPSFTASQIQAVKRSQLRYRSLARRNSQQPSRRDVSPCVTAMVLVELDILFMVFGSIGLSDDRELVNSIGMTLEQAYSLTGPVETLFSRGASRLDRALAAFSAVGSLFRWYGVRELVRAITANMTWWDGVKLAITLSAQLVVWFASDGAALIAEMVLLIEGAVDLVADSGTAITACARTQTPTPTLPPASVQIAVMEQLNGAKANMELFLLDAQGSIHHRFQLPDLSWTGWEQFPHSKTFSRLAAGRNQGGNLEVYGIGSDQALWQKYQESTSPTRAWTGWNSFGGSLSEIAAVTNTWGTLEVFASLTDSTVRHIYQTAPSQGWSTWQTLNNSPLVKQFAAAPNQNGNMVLFGLRTDGGISLTRQNSNGNGGWENWGDFQASGVSYLVATRNVDIVEAFCIGSDKRVYHRWQNGANSYSWVDWVPLYVQENSQLTKQAKQLAVTQQSDGRPVLFLIGLDDAVYFTALTTSGWSAWQSLSGPASSIKAITAKNGMVHLYGLFSGDKSIRVAHQLKATDPLLWSNWIPLN